MDIWEKVRISFGESDLTVPRNIDSSFNPIVAPKNGNMVYGIETIIVSLYAVGMSLRDIEEQIHEAYRFQALRRYPVLPKK